MQTKVNIRLHQIALICVMLFPLCAAAETITSLPVEANGAPTPTIAQPKGGKSAPEQPKFDCPGADCSVPAPVNSVAAGGGSGGSAGGAGIGTGITTIGIGLLVIILILF